MVFPLETGMVPAAVAAKANFPLNLVVKVQLVGAFSQVVVHGRVVEVSRQFRVRSEVKET